MYAPQSLQQRGHLDRQCPARSLPTTSSHPKGIQSRIDQVGNSTTVPRWKTQGQALQRLALANGTPLDAWSARALIAPLKKTLSDMLLIASTVPLDAVTRLFSAGCTRDVSRHINGLARQLMPFGYVGVQGQSVSEHAGTETSTLAAHHPPLESTEQRMNRAFKQRLLKALINGKYLTTQQLAHIDERQFIGALIRFLENAPRRAAPLLVRNILRMRGEFGAYRGEFLSVTQQEQIIACWLERYLLSVVD